MITEVSNEFLKRIGSEILDVLRTHEVSNELEFSIASDILFSVASALDDEDFVKDRTLKIDDSLHEQVYGFFDDWYEPFEKRISPHRVLFELKIFRERGKTTETNFVAHWLERPNLFIDDLEVSMSCRTLDELDKDISNLVNERFEQRNQRFGNVKEIHIKLPKNFETDKWDIIEYQNNKYGKYEHSLNGLAQCILDIARKNA